MQTARQRNPFRIADHRAPVVALVHFSIVSKQKARRTYRTHGLLPQPTIEVRSALELKRCHMLDRLIDCNRLEDEHLYLGNEEVWEDHDMRRAVDHDLSRTLLAVCIFHRSRIVWKTCGISSKPVKRFAIAPPFRTQ